ncbi:MAG: molybdenum cofactor biosynthesis protein MoaE [Candidatus Saliniplasma sp.]
MTERIIVTEDDFEIDELKDHILSESSGAVVVFNGVVRGNSRGKKIERLEIQRYPEMTEEELNKVRDETINNFKVDEVLIVHRYGDLKVGDNIVGIVVTAPHRDAAFSACRYCIDRLKEIVPLWKKEKTENGETEWIGESR